MRRIKRIIGLTKHVLSEKLMNQFVRLRAKTCSYLIDDDSERKKQKALKGVS